MGFKTKKAAQTTELTCHKRVVGGWRGQRDIAEGECLGVSSKQTAESESLTKAMANVVGCLAYQWQELEFLTRTHVLWLPMGGHLRMKNRVSNHVE